MKMLVAGWFSFENGHATAGDMLARDVACEWMKAAGWSPDVSMAAPFEGGVDLDRVDPADYSHLLFVCGPFEQGELEARLLGRFGHCRLIGLNLSMSVPLDQWSPFDLLLERDSSRAAHPDIVFTSRTRKIPVIGVCRVEPFPGAADHLANAAIDRLVASGEMAVVEIDTRLDANTTGLRTAAEVEALIARVDVLITTRLHGLVLALKNGVPAIAIDPIAGGAKIRKQAQTIGWPIVFNTDCLSDVQLHRALTYCLTDDARRRAVQSAARARLWVDEAGDALIAALADPEKLERTYRARQASSSNGAWMDRYAVDRPVDNRGVARRRLRGSIARRIFQLVSAVTGRTTRRRGER
ncbi:MAG: polysaccharide pyruvyl transferase family protein [Rhodothermales bacterium]